MSIFVFVVVGFGGIVGFMFGFFGGGGFILVMLFLFYVVGVM